MKNIYCLILLICSQFAFSQLGINTDPEIGTMVKIRKDSDSDIIKINNKSKDVLLLNKDGNLGINTSNPTNLLVIEEDNGSSGIKFKTDYIPNNVIVSDEYGNAFIEERKFIGADYPEDQTGKLIRNMENNIYISTSTLTPIYTDLSITLPKGQWIVNVDLSVELYERDYEGGNSDIYVKYNDVIVNDYSIMCSFYLNESKSPNRENRFTVENGLLLKGTPNQISSIISLSQNNTNIRGRFIVDIKKDSATAYLVANCSRQGLNGDRVADVGVRPYINFNREFNHQFYATPL